jgi:TM2 domain-containing membrane protein YozV
MRNRTSAAIFALLLGGVGAHKFYLGRAGQGLLYLVFFWTFIPAFVGFIEGIMFLTMSDAEFNAKYNQGMMFAFAAPPPPPQNIVVSVANTATGGGSDRVTRLKDLHDLRTAGALSDTEYETEKQRLLGSAAN